MLELFNRSPWQRNGFISLNGSSLGQASQDCEPTPEGGKRCADGMYYPPGCEPGSSQGVPAKPLIQDFPVVPVALAVAGVAAAGAILLSGEEDYPTEAMSKVQELANSIKAERAADSWNHQKYVEKRKENIDLLEKERVAQAKLFEEEKRWEESHRNAAELEAAQNELNAITQQRSTVQAEAEDYRQSVLKNAERILYYRQEANYLIEQMASAYQAEARRLIDPCYQPVAMKGRSLYPVVNQAGRPVL